MRNWLAASAILLLTSATTRLAVAQTGTPQITITSSAEQKVIAGSPERFTGSVRVQALFDPIDPSRTSGGAATFQPGARSAWHTHPLGQILIVTDGEGWLQQWGACPGHTQRRCCLDSTRSEALARSHADHSDDSHRCAGDSQRRRSELARTRHQ